MCSYRLIFVIVNVDFRWDISVLRGVDCGFGGSGRDRMGIHHQVLEGSS